MGKRASPRRVAPRIVAPLIVALAIGGCRPPPAQVLIIVDAQPAVRQATAGLSVNIFGGDRDTELPMVRVHDVIEPTSADDYWPRRFAVTPEDGDPTRLYRFEAIGRRTPEAQGEEVATARVISGYQAGETLQIYLFLYDACIGVPCEDPRETCDPASRQCRDARQSPDDLMPFIPEAGLPDAGVPVQDCDADADCADAHECTEDRCIDGQCSRTYVDSRCDGSLGCMAGHCSDAGCTYAPDDGACDDGVDCTEDVCSATGCVSTPSDALCTAGTGGRCDADNGCQYDTCDPEVCVAAGPCETASCSGTLCVRTSCGVGECCRPSSSTCLPIDDGETCTLDSCGADGPVNTPRSGLCDDGDGCTVGDACDRGVCSSGPRCDRDLNPCRAEMCSASGGCDAPPLPNGTLCGPSGSCNRCMNGTCEARICGMDAGPPPDAGRDAGRDAGDAGRDADAGDADAGDADAGDAGRDAGGTPCTSDTCFGSETCCGMTCCDLSSTTCCDFDCCEAGEVCGEGGWCVPMDAGAGDGGDACRSSCADLCCPSSSGWACCLPGQSCGAIPAGGCVTPSVCDGGPCTMMM